MKEGDKMANFSRKSFGQYRENDSFYSLFHGTDSFLIEDELNEAQWGRIEQIASALRLQLNSGFTNSFSINTDNYTNFFAIDGINADSPISILVDGYQLKIGANVIPGQPGGLISADNRLIVKLNTVGAANRTDLVLLEAWFEVMSGTDTINKFGGVETPSTTNNIIDSRLGIETSRRVQLRWRVRSIDNKNSITGVTALKYDGTDSAIEYSSLGSIYVADTTEQKLGNNSLKSPGIVYAIPLFTVSRNASDVVTFSNITDISPKAIPVDGVVKDFIADPTNLIQNATNRLVSDIQITSWDDKLDTTGGILTGSLTLNADPTLALHAATKQYVDFTAQGLDIKPSVKVATTADITLSGTQTIDGIALVSGDRVLVKNQTTGSQNGIYVVAAGAWTRAWDSNNSAEVSPGIFTFVEQGTTNGDSGWVLTTDAPITLDSTELTFSQFSGAGQIIAGTGLTKSGNTLSITNTGVSTGTYKSITVNEQGQVTSGTNPTTLAGYGITDAADTTHTHSLTLSGDATGSVTLDNSADTLSLTLTNSGVTIGTYPKVTVDIKGRVTSGTTLAATDIPSLDWDKITTGKPTTLTGYGITDGVNTSEVVTVATANKILKLDASAFLPTSITGNAETATKLATGRTISLTGDATGVSGTFDGSSNVSFAVTLTDSGVVASTYKSVTVDSKGRVTAGTNPTTLSGYGITDASPIPVIAETEPSTDLKEGLVWYQNSVDTAKMYLDGSFRDVGGLPPRISATEPTVNLKNGLIWLNTTNNTVKVYLDGLFKNIGGTALSSFNSTITLNTNTSTFTHDLEQFNKDLDAIFVYKNGTFLQKGADYNISVDGLSIEKIQASDGQANWLSGSVFDIMSIASIPTENSLYTIQYENTVTTSTNGTTNVQIGIPQYGSNTDVLEVYVDGVRQILGHNYSINANGVSIDLLGWSASATPVANQFLFVVRKQARTTISSDAIDGRLITDESITMNQLSNDFQILYYMGKI
jgi:phage-related tail fiber protein